MKKREVTVSTVVIPRNGIISPLKNRVKTKTMEEKKKNENNSTCFLRVNLNGESAVTIITDVSPLLPPPRARILLFPLIHSFTRHPLYVLLKKKEKKKKRSPEPLFQRLRYSDFFFPHHSIVPSNGRFMLMHLRPSTVGDRVHCLVACRPHIVDSTFAARHWNGKL